VTQKNTGGPAFPIAPDGAYIPDCENPETHPQREFPGHPGMTLRDYFAGQALAGTLAQGGVLMSGKYPESAARDAYGFADAMIEARNK